MSSAVPQSDSGGEAGRVRCLYCGANNFPNTAACWQCGRPLKAVHTGPLETNTAPSTAASYPPLPGIAPRPVLVESALAPKAAAAMGLLFPYVGLPVGMVFLMLDDPRKTQLGWMLIGWSLLGGVLNAIALAVTLVPLWALLKGMLPHGGSPSGAPPSGLPGVPNLGGDDPGLLLPRLLALAFFLLHV